MDAERKAIVDFLSRPEIKDFAMRSDAKYQIKCAEESIKARKKGNNIYIKKKHTADDHQMILYFYNKSIAYAPNESEELMYAYSNRAYLLMHVNKNNEAIDSLDKALRLTNSSKMKLKLYCQKVKCLAALGSSTKDDVLKEIDEIFHTSKISVEDATLVSTIIEKTKSEVASMKQFKPTDQKFLSEEKERNKIIIEKEKVDSFDVVEIKSTKNMGKGLYAKTDFKTGDIVLIEKPCLIQPDFSNQYVFCSQCLAVAWTGIPCETCHDYIFCSLKCKSMAWEDYHHIECSITPYLILYNPQIVKWIHMSLKFLISLMKNNKTINEFKSKLKFSKKNQVEMINEELEQRIELFNKLMSFSHILPQKPNFLATCATINTLIYLMKYTSFFPEQLKNLQYNDLSKNKDFIFIGSLLLRLVKISAVNVHCIADESTEISSEEESQKHLCHTKSRGFCMGVISSMTNNSCTPNIRRCFTDDMKYVFYAMEPITRGTQLLDAYKACFYNCPLMRRKELHENFVCQCIACEEDWPSLLIPDVDEVFMSHKQQFEPKTFFTELRFMQKISPLVHRMTQKNYYFDKDLIQAMTDMMNEIVQVLPQPSLARSTLFYHLDLILGNYYGLTINFENSCCK
ncbi:SET and MYND domain-containing protein 4-like [Trichogramma pretiosum]|uniref:SET and MYND domain-containing protein 4-like n=1 Tax=Trichogramma pretiosum TaxID=7493 RepID=UPI0006C94EAD|nr:SET and MYND domain-containing protein 4-like [Trichogramma pretiosum]